MTKRRGLKHRSPASTAKPCSLCSHTAALISCDCVSPPTLLCAGCIPTHITSQASHNITRLSSALQSLKLENSTTTSCSGCCATEATLICCCQYPPALLCQNCISGHVNKPPIALHTPLPLSVRDWVTSQDYVETLRKRQLGKEQAKQILLANLAKVDEAEKAIQAQCKWLVAIIKDYQEDSMQELWKVKEDLSHLIKSAVREVEDHMYEEAYIPSNYLAATIWNFHFMPVESELNLFSYQVDADQLQQRVKEMVSIRVETKGQHTIPPYIPIVNSTSLRKFYYQSETISPPLPLSSAIKVDMTSAWLFLDDGRVFACGRHSPPSAAAYMIDTSNGKAEELESMASARCQQGMVLFNMNIYVFGGLSKKYLSSCEKYSIPERKWAPLPDLLDARDGFNPICWRNAIYIVGGSNTTAGEVFDPLTETFSRLPMQLPKADCSISLVDDGDLVVLQRDAVYRWKLNSAERDYRESKMNGGGAWSNATPVMFQHTVYFLNCWTNSIGKCGLLDFSFHQASFTY